MKNSKRGIAQLDKIIDIRRDNRNYAEECDEIAGNAKKSNEQSLLEYMYESFGGFAATVGATKTALAASQKLFKNNEKYQKTTRMLEGAVPLVMTAKEVYNRIKTYRESHCRAMPKEYVDHEGVLMQHLLDCGERHPECYYGDPGILDQITNWIAQGRPPIVEAVLDLKWNLVYGLPEEDWTMYFLVNIEGVRFCMKLSYVAVIDDVRVQKVYYHDVTLYAISMALSYAYLSSFDMEKNIICLDNKRSRMDISTLPRQHIEHSVYQLEDSFFAEIKNSLKKKKKRGYALVGKPGVGKTTVLNKIIDEIRGVPVIMIKADGTKEPEDIHRSLVLAQMIAPCMVILEDIDMLPMQYKDSRHLSTFIEYLDSAKYDAPVIFLATMNEPELIHESLMDRKGRFDKIMVVNAPSSKEEIKEIMQNVYHREMGTDMPDILTDQFYDKTMMAELRHSDYTEILNRLIINDMAFNLDNLMMVLDDMCQTQDNVQRFKDRKQNTRMISIEDLKKMATISPSTTLADVIDKLADKRANLSILSTELTKRM